MFSKLSIASLATLLSITTAFDINAKTNVALYWGQNSAGTQQRLVDYCKSSDGDIFLLSFLVGFPAMQLNFANACWETFPNTSPSLLHCDTIAEDIKSCQDMGKIVMLSLGGAAGSYGFSNDEEAENFAQTLWDTFGAGTGVANRPFNDAIVDGFDFDIENNNSVGYAALVTKLRELFKSDSGRRYYISGSPQSPYPDASLGNMLSNSDVDFAFIQFYNNWNNVIQNFNWDTWLDYANNVSPNKDIKLFIGLPGSPTAAGSGYVSDLGLLSQRVQEVQGLGHFGGFSVWDASQAFSNIIDGQSYANHLKQILLDNTNGSNNDDGSSSGSASTSTSANEYTTTTTTTTSTIEPPPTTTSSSITTTTSHQSSSSTSGSLVPTTLTTTTTHLEHSTSTYTSTTYATTLWTTYYSTVYSTSTVTRSTLSPHTTTTLSPPSSTENVSPAHQKAIELNKLYAAGKYNGQSGCTDGEIACSADGRIAMCNFGAWVTMQCAAGTTCFAFDSDGIVLTQCNYSYLKEDYE